MNSAIFHFNHSLFENSGETGYRSTGAVHWTPEGAQVVLDMVGASEVPGLSQLADLASAAISFGTGDKVSGGLGLVAMLPLIGEGATGLKWGRKLYNAVDGASDVAREVSVVTEVAEQAGKHSGEVEKLHEGVEIGASALHHMASDKHFSRYTEQFAEIAGRHGLNLNSNWNKVWVSKVYHFSKHPEKYHAMVLDIMQAADKNSFGNPDKFIELFREGVLGELRHNPNILNKKGW
jgi:hypothetical protein